MAPRTRSKKGPVKSPVKRPIKSPVKSPVKSPKSPSKMTNDERFIWIVKKRDEISKRVAEDEKRIPFFNSPGSSSDDHERPNLPPTPGTGSFADDDGQDYLLRDLLHPDEELRDRYRPHNMGPNQTRSREHRIFTRVRDAGAPTSNWYTVLPEANDLSKSNIRRQGLKRTWSEESIVNGSLTPKSHKSSPMTFTTRKESEKLIWVKKQLKLVRAELEQGLERVSRIEEILGGVDEDFDWDSECEPESELWM